MSPSSRPDPSRVVLVLVEAGLLFLVVVLAAGLVGEGSPLALSRSFVLRALLCVAVLQLGIYYGELYDDRALRSRTQFFVRLGQSFAAGALVLGFVSYLFPVVRDVDGSDDEAASESEDYINLAEEAHDVPDSLATSITYECADEHSSRASVGVQTMTVRSTDGVENKSRRGISRTLFAAICGTASRLTKERVIVSITIMALVALMVLIERMSGLELLDEKRIIQDLTSQILPSQQQQQQQHQSWISTSAAPPPPTSSSSSSASEAN